MVLSTVFIPFTPLLLLSLLPLLLSTFTTLNRQDLPRKRAYLGITFASLLMGVLSIIITNSDSNLVVGIPFFLLGSTMFYYLPNVSLEQPNQNRVWFYLDRALNLLTLRSISHLLEIYQFGGIQTTAIRQFRSRNMSTPFWITNLKLLFS